MLLNAPAKNAIAQNIKQVNAGNFGLPGIIDLPTAKRFPDGEIVLTQQVHESLARSGITFQALPWVGFSFRYTGHGVGGGEAYGRINHDRSFDAHLSLLNEGKYLPAMSLGLRDFIGTGWYSSEYIVGTKSFGSLELTAGIGFGRLAGRDTFPNPLGVFSSKFDQRGTESVGLGGTLGTINWFQGNAAAFYGLRYQIGKKIIISTEYSPDLMMIEKSYLDIKSPWNFGLSYRVNNYVSLSTQYLHGSKVSLTANVTVNPARPPLLGGKDLAPVPMRMRGKDAPLVHDTDETIIKKVLQADRFEVYYLNFEPDTVHIGVENTKFRSTAQSIGRVTSTLQRFTSDEVKFAKISFYSHDLRIASYFVDLEKVIEQQFNPVEAYENNQSIEATDLETIKWTHDKPRFTWGIGPYVAHRLFNPDLPLSVETGIQITVSNQLAPGVKISGTVRKSLLTNLTDNKRRSNSVLPRVHSDWPLYDFGGQSGHIHALLFPISLI